MGVYINALLKGMMIASLFFYMSVAKAAAGDDTAAALRARYFDTSSNCGSPTTPRFLCAGLVLKGTKRSSDEAKSWNPTFDETRSGGVSFSFLSQDATFNRLLQNDSNGYILYPVLSRPENKIALQVLCFFPVESRSETRDDAGCGESSLSPATSRACHTQGILTAKRWFENFQGNPARQCGFDVRSGLGAPAVTAFNEGVRAISLIQSAPFIQSNELRVAAWPQDIPAQLPIQALFYVEGRALAVENAQRDQRRFYQETGIVLPIITLSLPASIGQGTAIHFRPDAQADLAGVVCERNIESGRWYQRDIGSLKDVWTLELVPTDCARSIKGNPSAEAEEAAYAEVHRKFSSDWQWVQLDQGGMRQQVICHIRIAHDKPEWNLEPFRPNLSLEDYLAAGCNPL